MSRLVKVGMYLLSLWLLFVLVIVNKAVIDVNICLGCSLLPWSELSKIVKENLLPLVCVAMLAASAVFYMVFVRIISGAKDGPIKVEELEDKNAEHLVFLATYIIPLVGFSLDSPRQMINLGITLLLLGAIYIKTDLFYANPTLSLLGFKIFNIRSQGSAAILISKEELEAGDSVNVVRLDKKIFFARKATRV
ncbi:anti-phage protein KwaA [Paraburkholderia xenovorans]|nr:anti-phage protein KwaA [Paraburkholderia xenovorans]